MQCIKAAVILIRLTIKRKIAASVAWRAISVLADIRNRSLEK